MWLTKQREVMVTKTERGPFPVYADSQNARSLPTSETTELLGLRPPGVASAGTTINCYSNCFNRSLEPAQPSTATIAICWEWLQMRDETRFSSSWEEAKLPLLARTWPSGALRVPEYLKHLKRFHRTHDEARYKMVVQSSVKIQRMSAGTPHKKSPSIQFLLM